MLKKLLDFDEVCFEGAIVQEERRVGPGSEVFELSRLPGDDAKRWTGRTETEGEKHLTQLFDSVPSNQTNQTVMDVKTESYVCVCYHKWHCGLMFSTLIVGLAPKTHSAGSGHLFKRLAVCAV